MKKLKTKKKSGSGATKGLDRARRLLNDLNKRSGEKGGGDYMYLTGGKNIFRVLPVETAEGDFFKLVNMHFKAGANQENIRCPRDVKKRCPLCDKRDKITNKEKRKEYHPRQQAALVVMPIAPNKSDKPKVLICATTVFKEILKYYTDVDEYGPITDLEDGRDIVATRTGEGFDTEYSVSLRDAAKSLKLDSDIMDDAPSLDEKYSAESYYSAEKINAIVEGVDYEDDDEETEDDDDEAPRKKKKFKAKSKASANDDEESEESSDDDDTGDDDEEGEEDSSDDSDDDDSDDEEEDEDADDDSDDEEEEEPPRKKKLKSSLKKRR